MEISSKEGWKLEKESLNLAVTPFFIYGSIFGIMIYSIFDYYSSPEKFLIFFILRVAVSISGIVLLILLKRKFITSATVNSLFLVLVYSFFAYGASVLSNINQLFVWNMSIIVAGMFWPLLVIIIDYKKAVFLNIYFLTIYLIFYLTNSAISFTDLLVYGGVFFIFAIIVSPIITYAKHRMHHNDFINKLELIESEDKYKSLVQFMEEGVIRSDIHGNVTLANFAMAKMLGYNSPDEMIGMPIVNLYTEEQRNSMVAELNKTGKIFNYEISTKSKNNAELYLLCNIKEIYSQKGQIVGREGIIRDITQLKKADKELKESEVKLKELNAAKDKFFSILAHDLKNPFSGILGLSQHIANSSNQYSRDDLIQYIGAINQSAYSAYKLLENLLEWSKTQTGRFEFKPEPFSFKELLSEVLNLTKNIAETKNITISIQLIDDMIINADKNMIHTVLRNLVSNAIKFTPRNGSITIQMVQLHSEIQITISDTGIGMTEETKNKLFKISEKVSTLGTEGEKGTGLGLLLCKEFVEKHKGKIWVESELGKGSSFKFTMPLGVDNQLN